MELKPWKKEILRLNTPIPTPIAQQRLPDSSFMENLSLKHFAGQSVVQGSRAVVSWLRALTGGNLTQGPGGAGGGGASWGRLNIHTARTFRVFGMPTLFVSSSIPSALDIILPCCMTCTVRISNSCRPQLTDAMQQLSSNPTCSIRTVATLNFLATHATLSTVERLLLRPCNILMASVISFEAS